MTVSHPIPGFLWITQLAEQLNLRIARHVQEWPTFEKESLGDQLVRATDSIGLNISEGYVRVHLKERLHFLSIADGSVEEALFAIRRARDRELLSRLDAWTLSNLLIKMSRALNAFASALRKTATVSLVQE